VKRPLKKSIAIIGEGETEQAYFSYIRKSRRYPIAIKPDLPSNSNFRGIFHKAEILLRQDYDLVFCLIDLDVIISNRITNEFLSACAKLPATIIPIASNPCTEVWFLMHFTDVTVNHFHESCDSVVEILKKNWIHYKKGTGKANTQDYFHTLEHMGSMERALINSNANIKSVIAKKHPFKCTFTEIPTIFSQLKICSSCDFSAECENCKRISSTVFMVNHD